MAVLYLKLAILREFLRMHVRAQQTFKELNDLSILKIHYFADHVLGVRCRGFNGKGSPPPLM